jgi:hypothetical protein
MPNNHTLPSHLRLCSLFVASYDSQEIRWRYSNPPPHGVARSVSVSVTLQLTVSQSVSLGVEPNVGLLTRDIFFFESYSLVWSVSLTLVIMPRGGPNIKHSFPTDFLSFVTWTRQKTLCYVMFKRLVCSNSLLLAS